MSKDPSPFHPPYDHAAARLVTRRMYKGNDQGFENVIVSKVVRIWVALPLHKSIDTLQYRGIRASSIYGQVFYSSAALCSC